MAAELEIRLLDATASEQNALNGDVPASDSSTTRSADRSFERPVQGNLASAEEREQREAEIQQLPNMSRIDRMVRSIEALTGKISDLITQEFGRDERDQVARDQQDESFVGPLRPGEEPPEAERSQVSREGDAEFVGPVRPEDEQPQAAQRGEEAQDDEQQRELNNTLSNLARSLVPRSFQGVFDRIAGLIADRGGPERESRGGVVGFVGSTVRRAESGVAAVAQGSVNVIREGAERVSRLRESARERVASIRDRLVDRASVAREVVRDRVSTTFNNIRESQIGRDTRAAAIRGRRRFGEFGSAVAAEAAGTATGRLAIAGGRAAASGVRTAGAAVTSGVARAGTAVAGGVARVAGGSAIAGAAGGGAGAAAGGGAALAAALGPVGIAAAAVVAGLGAAVISVRAFSNAMSRTADSLEDFSVPIATARAEGQVTREFQRLDRAERLGEPLADISRAQNRLDEASYELQTRMLEVLLKFEPQIETMIDSLAAGVAGVEVITATFDSFLASFTPDIQDDKRAQDALEDAMARFGDAVKEIAQDNKPQNAAIDPFFADVLQMNLDDRDVLNRPRRPLGL